MRSGKLNWLFTALTNAGATRNSYGERIDSWTQAFQFWGELLSLSGRQLEQDRVIAATVTHRINARFNQSLTPSMLIRLDLDRQTNPRKFSIDAVFDPTGDGEKMTVLCTELVL